MDFPKSSYVVTVDIWFQKPDGSREPSRGIWTCYAESAEDALRQHEIDVRNAGKGSYAWEDVQVLSVMTYAEHDDVRSMEYRRNSGN